MQFSSLDLWVDQKPRSGPENMAVDEWLWERLYKPTLRVYQWSESWGSFGYFTSAKEATSSIHGLQWVRRHTGGGIVDHRSDWTYTVFIPKLQLKSTTKSLQIYCDIHDALARAIRVEGYEVGRSDGDNSIESNICFEKPVSHDLINSQGMKIAGAGQRRGKHGIMHQGSLAISANGENFAIRAMNLAKELSTKHSNIQPAVNQESVDAKVAARYGTEAWTNKRP